MRHRSRSRWNSLKKGRYVHPRSMSTVGKLFVLRYQNRAVTRSCRSHVIVSGDCEAANPYQSVA